MLWVLIRIASTCCGYSYELHRRYMFLWRNKQNYPLLSQNTLLICSTGITVKKQSDQISVYTVCHSIRKTTSFKFLDSYGNFLGCPNFSLLCMVLYLASYPHLLLQLFQFFWIHFVVSETKEKNQPLSSCSFYNKGTNKRNSCSNAAIFLSLKIQWNLLKLQTDAVHVHLRHLKELLPLNFQEIVSLTCSFFRFEFLY